MDGILTREFEITYRTVQLLTQVMFDATITVK